ncbi:MAG: von Willebrand factor type A domain-containing protein [Acidobacteria bacterium OLB17]|nr:MAG: von Willebrand factor type A domain-containing protein [Acidobacteria bacterium OLB17]
MSIKRSSFFRLPCACSGSRRLRRTTAPLVPRVAPTPVPTPTPVTRTDRGMPPVLGGGRNTPTQPDTTQTDDVVGGDDDVIRVETNLVTMPVSVLDRDGRFISGLSQQDFQIFENGVPQKVEYFQSVEQPFTVVLLLDVSPSTQFRMDEIQRAAMAFVDSLRPADRVMVMSFDEYIHVLSPITNNRYELKNAIRQAQFGDGTSLYDAVDDVIRRRLSGIEGRKAVVLFTDGVDTTSRRATIQSTTDAAEELDALIYPIRFDTSGDLNGGMGSPVPRRQNRRVTMVDILGAILSGGNVNVGSGAPGGGTRAEYERGRQYLLALAQKTGGREFEADSIYNLQAAFTGIAEELRRQYTLGYYPEKAGTIGERRQIKIRVHRPNVVVRAKTSYIVGDNKRTLAGV